MLGASVVLGKERRRNIRHMKTLFYLTLVLAVHANEAARILCIFPFDGKSHFIMFETLCKGLARRGHQIDMVSHFPSKEAPANYTDIIDLSGSRPTMVNSFSIDYGKHIQETITYHIATKFGGSLCNLMGEKKMQKLIKNPPKDPPYDLVITEYFGSPCYLGFGELLRVPVIVAVSFLEMPYVNSFAGNPQNYAFFPGFFTAKPTIDTFFDRLWNFLVNYNQIQIFYYYTSDQTDLMRKYLGLSQLPDVRELEKKVSLVLANSHHSLFGIRPLTQSIVEVGGLHVHNDQPKLSPEVDKWLKSANHGLVYFTMGSLMNAEMFPRETMSNLYASFAKIAPVKILMKCVNVTKLPPGLPSNVLTSPWISQVAVLKHINTRVFITHGGLMGTQEALYYGVPMIGIPVFADQMKNVNHLVHKNMAIMIHVDDINEHTVSSALYELLHDPKYRESAENASRLFRDRPSNALDTAIYWVEYVIRNGPDCLKSPATNLYWWQLNLLDIFVFLIVCLLFTIYFFAYIFKIILSYLRSRVRTEKKIN